MSTRRTAHIVLLGIALSWPYWRVGVVAAVEVSRSEAAETWLRRAFAEARKGEWRAASAELRKFALTGIPNLRAQHLQAYVLCKGERFVEAAQLFYEVLKQKPESFAASYHLAVCLHRMEYFSQAVDVLKKIPDCKLYETNEPWYPRTDSRKPLVPPNLEPQLVLLLAECNLDWGEALSAKSSRLRREADARLEAVLKVIGGITIDSNVDEGIRGSLAFVKASALKGRKRHEEARAAFGAMRREFPNHPRALQARFRAIVCVEKGEVPEQCFPLYEALIKEHPDREEAAEALMRMGLLRFEKKQYGQCRRIFQRFLQMFPSHARAPKVYFKSGIACILQAPDEGKELYREAGDHFREFGARYPKAEQLPATLYWAGDSYLKGGDVEPAYTSFSEVIKAFPDQKWAKYARGRLTSPVFAKFPKLD